ncbi:MAG: 3-hydroxyacyl-CoA dehydrogenase NAD-binding domain-containing protein [Chloroflexi bacterium]|nr:3-hydroxyacyl-CoA dehydrogenase NAD-binding domain-containing protein [Chloroflexota bacterium]
MPGDFQRAAVLGTGAMGPGTALSLARGGLDTVLISRSPEGAERGLIRLRQLVEFLVGEKIFSPDQANETLSHLCTTSDRKMGLAHADIVIESIVEDLGTKRDLFVALEEDVREDTLLCSNTSGLRISEIAGKMSHPERAFTTHFWNPPHLVPLVEIVVGDRSHRDEAERLRVLLRRCGKRPVVVLKDVPGQLGNRLQHALIREALSMLEQGIASAADIEEALKAGPGLRWPVYGPFEHSDIVGLDLTLAVQSTVLPSLARNTEPSPLLRDKLAAGKKGVSTGEGIYRWTEADVQRVVTRRDRHLVRMLQQDQDAGREQ